MKQEESLLERRFLQSVSRTLELSIMSLCPVILVQATMMVQRRIGENEAEGGDDDDRSAAADAAGSSRRNRGGHRPVWRPPP